MKKTLKKTVIVLLILFVLVGGVFSYISFKKNSLENAVIEYLVKEKNIDRDDIVFSEPFFSNLKGSKCFMVGIKLKNDNKTYVYYKEDGEIILESYVENGIEHVE